MMRSLRLCSKNYDTASLFRLWPASSILSPKEVPGLLGTYTTAMIKYPSLPEALAGRAQCLMQQGEYDAALADAKKAFDTTPATDITFKHFAGAVVARCRQSLLEIAEHKAAAGALTEEGVEACRKASAEDFLKASLADPADWGLALTLGEGSLERAPAEAERYFEAAKNALESEISARRCGTEVVTSADTPTEVALFVQTWLSTVNYTCSLSDKSFQTDALRAAFVAHLAARNAPTSLAEYGAKKNLQKLSTAELAAVVRISAQAHIGDNGFTRPLEVNEAPHKTWDGDAATSLQDRMDQFSGNVTRKNNSELSVLIRKVQTLAKGTEALEETTKVTDTLAAVPKGGDALAAVIETHGTPSRFAISASDKDFFELLTDIETAYAKIPTGIVGSGPYLAEQKALAIALLQQQVERAELGRGVAKAQQGQEEAALEILNGIVTRDMFFLMYRVFAARASVAKAIGNVEQADRDHRELHRLCVSTTDIPSQDVNRSRNDF